MQYMADEIINTVLSIETPSKTSDERKTAVEILEAVTDEADSYRSDLEDVVVNMEGEMAEMEVEFWSYESHGHSVHQDVVEKAVKLANRKGGYGSFVDYNTEVEIVEEDDSDGDE